MKKLKRGLLVAAAVLLCVLCIAGCAPKDQEETAAAGGSSLIQDAEGEIQPGANVQQFVNEEGQKEMHYQNPDGSGGGGVEID